MKKITLLVVGSLLITQYAISQNFISEDKQWNVKEDFWGDVHTEIFKIEGDTIINSVNYQKFWQSFDSTLVNWWLTAFIREDSDVVYFKPEYANEGILYDFNLDVGDTAYIINLYCDEMMVVVNDIDTINYFGIDRKRWSVDGEDYEYWLEGIGSNFGLLYSKYNECTADLQYSLLCFYQNDTLNYIEAGEDDCFQSSVGVDETAAPDNQITIYPNPTSTTITISTPSTPAKNTFMTIFSPNGKEMSSQRMTQPKTVVNIGGLPTGLYFVRMTNDKTVMVQKFIKQ